MLARIGVGQPMQLVFGECVFDRECRELRRAGQPVPLTPKAFHLLEVLLDASPRPLRKIELHQRLWPDTFVSNATLTSLVAEVRTAIGDTRRDSRWLRTLHGYGYAFVGESRSPDVPLPTMVARLTWQGREKEIGPGEHFIGRAPECAIHIDDRRVSRRHARLTAAAATLLLADLQSHNGTFVNGTRVSGDVALSDQDVITVGGLDVSVRLSIGGGSSTIDLRS